MCVRRVKTKGCIIDAGKRDPQGVEPSNLSHVHRCHGRALLVGCVAGHVKAPEEEIFSNNILCALAWEPIHTHCNNNKLIRKNVYTWRSTL